MKYYHFLIDCSSSYLNNNELIKLKRQINYLEKLQKNKIEEDKFGLSIFSNDIHEQIFNISFESLKIKIEKIEISNFGPGTNVIDSILKTIFFIEENIDHKSLKFKKIIFCVYSDFKNNTPNMYNHTYFTLIINKLKLNIWKFLFILNTIPNQFNNFQIKQNGY